MEDHGAPRNADQNRNIRRRLSLRRPDEALPFALRQLTFVAASLDKSSTDPGCDVNVKIQTDLLRWTKAVPILAAT
jgi:hypothetical protein